MRPFRGATTKIADDNRRKIWSEKEDEFLNDTNLKRYINVNVKC